VVAVAADRGLVEALRLLVVHGVRHLVVVDHTGRCVGVLADRSIAAAWARDPMGLERWHVADVLPAAAAVVDVGATVGEVARLMHRHGVDAVAVLAHLGSPIGIVTATDLVNVLAGGHEHDKEPDR